MVAKQVVHTTEQLVGKGNLLLMADLLDNFLQWAYEKACSGVCFVDYDVVE